jgi:hypothetical protein
MSPRRIFLGGEFHRAFGNHCIRAVETHFLSALILSCTTQRRRKNYLAGTNSAPFSVEIGLGRFNLWFSLVRHMNRREFLAVASFGAAAATVRGISEFLPQRPMPRTQ